MIFGLYVAFLKLVPLENHCNEEPLYGLFVTEFIGRYFEVRSMFFNSRRTLERTLTWSLAT